MTDKDLLIKLLQEEINALRSVSEWECDKSFSLQMNKADAIAEVLLFLQLLSI
jgi:hypothetical protein